MSPTDQELLYILRTMARDENRMLAMDQADLIYIANRLQDKIREIAELKESLKDPR